MGVKCKIPTCRSYTDSPSGLCDYHERKVLEYEAASDFEQISPEERNRLKLLASQTREKFTARGADREERQRRCKANYGAVWQQINAVSSEANTSTDFRAVRERLKAAQNMCRETELLREDREALRNWIQQLFDVLSRRQTEARADAAGFEQTQG